MYGSPLSYPRGKKVSTYTAIFLRAAEYSTSVLLLDSLRVQEPLPKYLYSSGTKRPKYCIETL